MHWVGMVHPELFIVGLTKKVASTHSLKLVNDARPSEAVRLARFGPYHFFSRTFINKYNST